MQRKNGFKLRKTANKSDQIGFFYNAPRCIFDNGAVEDGESASVRSKQIVAIPEIRFKVCVCTGVCPWWCKVERDQTTASNIPPSVTKREIYGSHLMMSTG